MAASRSGHVFNVYQSVDSNEEQEELSGKIPEKLRNKS